MKTLSFVGCLALLAFSLTAKAVTYEFKCTLAKKKIEVSLDFKRKEASVTGISLLPCVRSQTEYTCKDDKHILIISAEAMNSYTKTVGEITVDGSRLSCGPKSIFY